MSALSTRAACAPLTIESSMSVADGRATYEREVRRANTRDKAGVTERGSGTVSPAGELTLTGSAAAQTWSYSATIRLSGAR